MLLRGKGLTAEEWRARVIIDEERHILEQERMTRDGIYNERHVIEEEWRTMVDIDSEDMYSGENTLLCNK